MPSISMENFSVNTIKRQTIKNNPIYESSPFYAIAAGYLTPEGKKSPDLLGQPFDKIL